MDTDRYITADEIKRIARDQRIAENTPALEGNEYVERNEWGIAYREDVRALLDHIDALEAKTSRLQSAFDKYRRLRMHVRKDGTVKNGFPRAMAARIEADRMTQQTDQEYTAFECWCGAWHIGRLRTAKETTNVG